jgi:hypothetical protein
MVVKPECKRPLEKPRREWENNKMDRSETAECELD